jgi:hypothetical protein
MMQPCTLERTLKGSTCHAQAAAAEAHAQVFRITAASITGAYLGESERRLRETFERAQAAAQSGVALVFIDEIDALCPRRGTGTGHGSRVVAQLLTLLDGALAVDSAHAVRCGPRHLVCHALVHSVYLVELCAHTAHLCGNRRGFLAELLFVSYTSKQHLWALARMPSAISCRGASPSDSAGLWRQPTAQMLLTQHYGVQAGSTVKSSSPPLSRRSGLPSWHITLRLSPLPPPFSCNPLQIAAMASRERTLQHCAVNRQWRHSLRRQHAIEPPVLLMSG